jgi:hypothetical protein
MDRLTEAEYVALLPARIDAIARQLSTALPDGLRFEWGPPADTSCENCGAPAVLIRRGRMYENGQLWPRTLLCEPCASATRFA